ncbi:type II CRISPR RNA-guided endonuclease Cas9 [Methylotenera sp.]|uniref:type II CRISPR RNA-guided endonuclease Cas9 n=3 Tax=Methylotenera sp. TaxID=2051956 RepID=UPI002721361F|nr:type II CRISPR RNA-guided endonuclease Cas9 [Methylotenera sp.]MDO9205517.1 type II CRISPR RNA-guided endonuclease Cas9 [Methylotenera sp.]MDP1521840.1 type II CRISPR RNA-guided endonuclease Cas9 [Methylotenera sp.]MDP2070700.1 type II CRISPR RNA-guided endonuclease Cas9 [Methylotenera sp.]MDP3004819.1 type II CRISPR RNA-guided endonuclease Cas9 [Methylotenera sp.]MDP3308027.1 type II CRISPR RNA-guided endonuclease Cas9 [Methylotenera sp.]
MRYRVGLDVGTASLGVAAFSLDESNNPLDLVWKHVRIFDEPLEKSQAGLKSKKAGRRAARMQRRQIDRRLGRTKAIATLSSLLGIQIEPSIDSGRTLLEIRAQAARKQIELSDLIRVFIRLGKRRGYGGEFRPKKEGAKLGEVEGGNHDLKTEMQALAQSKGLDAVTLGEFLYQRWLNGKPTKLKIKEPEDKTTEGKNLYALRSQLVVEFEQIWQTQSAFYPILNSQHEGKPLKEAFHRAIFYQRPLKAVGGMVGQCGLEPTLARAPRAQLAFQHFRIEKTLADLRWGAGKRAEKLSAAQKQVIRQLCDEKDVVKFEAIYKALETADSPKPETKGLNLDRLSRDEIPGNKTNQVFRKLDLGDAWQALDERTQIQVINFLADLGSPEQLDDPLWHTRFAKADGTMRQLPEAFVAFINLLKSHEKFDRLSKMGFEGGRASYSIKALKKLIDWLDTPWWLDGWQGEMRPDEDAAVRVCYPESFNKPVALKDKLDFALSTGNAVVDGSLRQMRYVLNRMMADLGAQPEQIVVEMAREMSVGVSKRNERESENNKNRTARIKAEDEICNHGVTVTPSRVRRYLLWVEQGKGHCPYCTKPITLGDALNGAETEYEHILPKSLTQVGLKRSEIVLAHRNCNQEKGNRTPYQAWGHDDNRWQIIQVRAKYFVDNRQFRKAKLLLLADFEAEVLTDESIDGFADRQFHQTSWIAKEAAQWLQGVCKTPVSVSRGELTAMLRRKWKLETVIPQARAEERLPILDEEMQVISVEDFEKYRDVWEGHRVLDSHGHLDKSRHTDRKLNKRIDHRHHLIDAITIGLTSRSLFQKMASQYKIDSEREARGQKPRLEVGEPPIKNVREVALAAIRECPLSIKPDRYPDGAIFQETAYGIAVKEGEDKARLALRVKVADLIDRKKGTVEQAHKAIQSIVSVTIREIIFKEFESRIASGKSAPEALAMPIYQTMYGQRVEIKKVKCFTGNYADDVAIISHTSKDGREHLKRLPNAGYAYLETEMFDGRIGKQELVNTHQAMKRKRKPLSENMVRLHKGDTVLDSKDGKKYRIGYFAAVGSVFLIPIVDPRAFDAIKEAESGKKKVSFSQVIRLKRLD